MKIGSKFMNDSEEKTTVLNKMLDRKHNENDFEIDKKAFIEAMSENGIVSDTFIVEYLDDKLEEAVLLIKTKLHDEKEIQGIFIVFEVSTNMKDTILFEAMDYIENKLEDAKYIVIGKQTVEYSRKKIYTLVNYYDSETLIEQVNDSMRRLQNILDQINKENE